MRGQVRIGAALLFMVGAALMGKGMWIGGKAVVAQILLERAWQQSVATQTPTLPWSWMDAYPIAKIGVPALSRSSIVLDTDSGQALAFGPVHMRQSPLPGQSGTAVIAAHKNTHFDFLKDLRTGDVIEMQLTNGAVLKFAVSSAKIVHKDNSNIPLQTPLHAPKRLALVTCYPFDSISFGGPMRYVVTANFLET